MSGVQTEEALDQFDNGEPQSEGEQPRLTEEEAQEAKWQERMANTYTAMVITIAPACIGWALLMFSMQVLDNMLLTCIACLVCVAPVLYSYMTSGWSRTLFFWQDYEVITTYSNGSTSSDSGAESAMLGLLYKAFMFGVVCMLAGIVSIGKCIYFPIKYTICYLKVQNKPNLKDPKEFVRTGFFLAALGFVTLIGAPMVGGTIQNIQIRQKIIANNTSDYSAKEIRKMLDDVQAKIFADNDCAAFSMKNYYIKPNYYEVDVNCRNDGKIEINVGLKHNQNSRAEKTKTNEDTSPAFMKLGLYKFDGNKFVEYGDGSEKPSDADIKIATNFLPQNYFFSKIKSAKDEQLKAKNWETSEQNLKTKGHVVEIQVRDAEDPSIKDKSKYPDRSKTVEYEIRIKDDKFQEIKNIRIDGHSVELK